MRIALIEDEPAIRQELTLLLQNALYEVTALHDFANAASAALAALPDLILLDINMPGMNGVEVCGKIRDMLDCPIIFLTARIEERDKIAGLRTGGDDYIVKPVSLKELLARIEAHLRREKRKSAKRTFRFDVGLCIDYSSRQIFCNNQEILMTKSEFDIIELLSSYPGQTFDREQIYEKLWGLERTGDNKIVTELIRRIRNKLKDVSKREYIETVWGCGYKWTLQNKNQ